MLLFIQSKNKENLFFHTANESIYNICYSIALNQIDIAKIHIDRDNIVYAYGNNTIFKVLENLIPLYFDVDFVHFRKNTFFISNKFIFKKKSESKYDSIQRAPENVQGIAEYNNAFITWDLSCIYISGKIIKVESEIKFLKVYKEDIYVLNRENIFLIYKKNTWQEILNLSTANITDICFNDHLPVVSFLAGSNIFILDIDNQKIVKVIESYDAKNITFKNKRELYIMSSEKVVQYHLGKDLVDIVLENGFNSRFFFFELKKSFKFQTDTFKEEVRSKLIENKIENKRMIFYLMNEIEELKRKIVDKDQK